HEHAGNRDSAARLAAGNRAAFAGHDTVLTLASGCHDGVAHALGGGVRTVDALSFLGERAAALRWPRARMARLVRDLGALAYAPAIRAEVRREPVRRLKVALDNSYLLALDSLVWDGKVQANLGAQLAAEIDQALRAGDDQPLFDLLDRRGRAELRLWAERRDPGLADWSRLLLPRELHDNAPALFAHLPPDVVERLHIHHGARPLTA
ncbi:hypothetical protein AB4084_16570, partial [Lysobacter sp. 2RAB21]